MKRERERCMWFMVGSCMLLVDTRPEQGRHHYTAGCENMLLQLQKFSYASKFHSSRSRELLNAIKFPTANIVKHTTVYTMSVTWHTRQRFIWRLTEGEPCYLSNTSIVIAEIFACWMWFRLFRTFLSTQSLPKDTVRHRRVILLILKR